MSLSQDDFSPDELSLIPEPEPEELQAMQAEAQANAAESAQTTATDGGGTAAAPAPAIAPAPAPAPAADAAPAPAPVAAPAPATAAVPASAPAQPGGDPKVALRASRRAERRALERVAALAEENERLRQLVPQQRTEELTDAEIDAAETDFPLLAKVARLTKQVAVSSPAPAPARAAPADEEFIPQTLPPVFQDAIDATPDLLAWQHDPDQRLFEAAKRMDTYVLTLPGWADRPLAERMAEVARRVKLDQGQASAAPAAPAAPQRIDPNAAIAAAPRAAPSTLSDIGGGGGKETSDANNLSRFARMSEEDILAELARG